MKEANKERTLIVHTPATCDRMHQLVEGYKKVQYWERWFYSGGESQRWNFLMQDPKYPDNPQKRVVWLPVSPYAFDLLKRMNKAIYEDLVKMGKGKDAAAALENLRREG